MDDRLPVILPPPEPNNIGDHPAVIPPPKPGKVDQLEHISINHLY
jgi:hypothetical protein